MMITPDFTREQHRQIAAVEDDLRELVSKHRGFSKGIILFALIRFSAVYANVCKLRRQAFVGVAIEQYDAAEYANHAVRHKGSA